MSSQFLEATDTVVWTDSMDEFLLLFYKKYENDLLSINSKSTTTEKQSLHQKMVLEFRRRYGAQYDDKKLKGRWRTLRNQAGSAKRKQGVRELSPKEKWLWPRCQFLIKYITLKDTGKNNIGYSASNEAFDDLNSLSSDCFEHGKNETADDASMNDHVLNKQYTQIKSNEHGIEDTDELIMVIDDESVAQNVETEELVFMGDHDYINEAVPVIENNLESCCHSYKRSQKTTSGDVHGQDQEQTFNDDVGSQEYQEPFEDLQDKEDNEPCLYEFEDTYDKNLLEPIDMNFPKKRKIEKPERELSAVGDIVPQIDAELKEIEDQQGAITLAKTIWEIYKMVPDDKKINGLKVIMDVLQNKLV